MARFKLIVPCFFLVILVACSAPEKAASVAERKEAPVLGLGRTPEETVRKFIAAYKAEDVEAIVSFYSDKALANLIPPIKDTVEMMDGETAKKQFGKTKKNLMALSDREFFSVIIETGFRDNKISRAYSLTGKIFETRIDDNRATVEVQGCSGKNRTLIFIKQRNVWLYDGEMK